jgi:dienelactone hydrolase
MHRFLLALALACPLFSQGTLADYQRAQDLPAKARAAVLHMPSAPTWIEGTDRFWYSRTVPGGHEFLLVDADSASKRPAFDHDRLATAISKATGGHYTGVTLPFAPRTGGRGAAAEPGLTFRDRETAIRFAVDDRFYTCTLTDYTCTKGEAVPAGRGAANREPAPEDPTEIGGDPTDGLAYEPPAPQAGTVARGPRLDPAVSRSPDGKWEALIQNYNVFLRPTGSKEPAAPLSLDGSEGNYYSLRTVAWSPDSRHLAAYHTRPGYNRQVHYIESSPADQIQPKHFTYGELTARGAFSPDYKKPGDALDIAYPVLFDVATRTATPVDPALFPNAFSLTRPVWWKDSRGFTFEYNQRGHQLYRVIEVDAATGHARALITETSPTFIYYNQLGSGLSAGRRYRHDVGDGAEIVWASERDGWEHLYLYNGRTGELERQITKGDWLVRNVDYVDDTKRQIWFEAGGSIPGQDPYFPQYYRIDFDGTGLTRLTDADGYHTVVFSPDRKFYVDTWSRIDLPPVSQLRRTEDRAVVMDLERTEAAGVHHPEVFTAKARDGKTDIWGVIVRPTNFDPSKKYPVIENIYAGPQGSFVPKTFSPSSPMQSLAELGFIVVQIDGMGTSNRSKAFHDVAWHNLADAGFPDRILWHQAVAAKYPWYDITRVGIYGTSAGGQNALGGALFHPDFYKVVVTNSGCHDNRMDKLWWNEQWMGWPIGPQYAASSNVDNAAKLQGHALIIAGEMDTNVDPASSLQVVNALVKAKKHFDMLYIPGQNHGVGVLSDQHYLQDYFVHHLLGVEPPDWNKVSLATVAAESVP